MKIAMLGHKRLSREGGVEIVVYELSKRMAKLGHDVTVYNRKGKHVLDKNVKQNKIKEIDGIKIKEAFTIDKKGLAAVTSSFFATLKILFSNAEVVHYHAEGPCYWMWIIKKFSKKRIIATIHGLDWQRAKWGGLATKFIKKGEERAVKYADEIIVLSKNVQNYFKEEYNRETIFIPNGVNKPEIVKADIITKKYGLKKDDYILFLGRMVPEKGIHYLIDAFKNLKTDKKLVIAGGASDTDQYYSDLKFKIIGNDNIIFTGFVQGKELEELYSNAYIYCLPSDLEGMPLSLLEAMSYKNCCVTSDIDECSEVLLDNGVTFKKSDVDDLSKVLQELCDDESKVKEYKKNAQKYVLDKYNWDDVVQTTLKLYEK
ncbi:MAG: glycosyltransferase family 4 protein [Candidatus Coprovivens sp.]